MKQDLLVSQRMKDLMAQCQTTHRVQYQRLLVQAQTYTNWLPPSIHPSKSITFIGMAAANLALAYRLSGQIEFLETLRKWLTVVIAYPHWGKERLPDHDLDAAWLLFGLSLAYDWVGDDLPAPEKTALNNKLLLQGQRLYDFALESAGQWWSSAYWQNHNWICFTGLASAAYALQKQHPETQSWSQLAFKNFNIVFNALPEDGSNSEGVVYWCYGVPWMMIYTDLAYQQEGVDFYQTPFLQNTFYYRLYMSGPNLVDTANFGDCHDRRSAHSRAVYYWFARHHRNRYAQWLAEYLEQTREWEREASEGLLIPGLKAQAFLDLLWYDPTVFPQPVTDLPLSRSFPDLGLVSARTSWSPDAVFLAFKSSVPLGLKAWAVAHNLINNHHWDAISGGHLHPDENSFILMRGSDYLAIDEGYSSAKQSIQHNTVLIDGIGQYHEGVYHVAKGLGVDWGAQLETVFAENGMMYVRGEAAGAYPPSLGLRHFQRQVLLWNENLVFIYDHLNAEESHRYEWLLQTDLKVEIESANQFAMINGESRLGVEFISPVDLAAKTHTQEVVAIPSSAQPDNVLRRQQHTLSICPKNNNLSAQFLAVLTLDHHLTGKPAQVERLDCSNGLGARIIHGNKQTIAGFAFAACFWRSGILFGTDSPWFAAESNLEGQIIRMAIGECTRTFINGQLWCAASSPVHFVYHGDGWYIKSNAPTWISIRVPTGAAVELNGTVFESGTDSEIYRQAVPGGESEILFR